MERGRVGWAQTIANIDEVRVEREALVGGGLCVNIGTIVIRRLESHQPITFVSRCHQHSHNHVYAHVRRSQTGRPGFLSAQASIHKIIEQVVDYACHGEAGNIYEYSQV